MEAIATFITKALWAIVGGTISIAFIAGVTGALAYMAYYLIRYGWKAFDKEFIPR